jgi:hypothetical protein
LLIPSISSRRDSSLLSEADLHQKQSALLTTLSQTSKPKHILQSLAFIISHTTQSLTKSLSTSVPLTPRTTAEKFDTEVALLPIKQALVDTAEKLSALQDRIAHTPKREYATIEARARALRAARTEAIDRLDEILASTESAPIPQDWNNDIRAARELIVLCPRFPPLNNVEGLTRVGNADIKDQELDQSIP